MKSLLASQDSPHLSTKLYGTEKLAALKRAKTPNPSPLTPRAEVTASYSGCSRSGVRAVRHSAEGVSHATASPTAALRAPGPPSTQPSKTASLALTAALRPPRGRPRGPIPRGRKKRTRKERPRYRCLAGARPGPPRRRGSLPRCGGRGWLRRRRRGRGCGWGCSVAPPARRKGSRCRRRGSRPCPRTRCRSRS